MGWSTEAGRGSLLGWGQGRWHGACVPGRVVAPWCHPGGPLHATKSWWPLGTAQLLVRVSGHPAWPGLGRPILSVSPWLFSVSLTTMLCPRQVKEQARGVTGSACGHSLSPRYTGDSQLGHWADPWPRTQVRRVGTVAGHVPATCRAHTRCVPCVLPVPRAPSLCSCLLLLVEWSHHRRADAPAGRANSSG